MLPPCRDGDRDAVPFATWDRRHFTEGSSSGHGRENPRDSGLYVSVLASDLPLDQGSDRPVRGSGHAPRLPPFGARSDRADDGAAGSGSPLLRQTRPGSLSGNDLIISY